MAGWTNDDLGMVEVYRSATSEGGGDLTVEVGPLNENDSFWARDEHEHSLSKNSDFLELANFPESLREAKPTYLSYSLHKPHTHILSYRTP